MADYCDVLCNWECDRDPTYVIDYFLENEKDSGKSEECFSFPGMLQIFKNADDDDTTNNNCEMTVQCKSLYHVGITGVRFVSESRNVEVYGQTEGYLQTVRGKSVPSTEYASNYFISEFSTQDPFLRLTFKFLSLKGKMSFEMKRIQITLTQMEPPDESSQMDIGKLRSHVRELGDKVSDKAKSLLDTMEQYQKNQRGTIENVQSMISQSTLPSGKASSMSGMAGLLTMFSQMNQKMPRSLRNPPEIAVNTAEEPSGLAGSLLSQISEGHNGDAMHSEDMYKFLHSVCGKVSKMRTKSDESLPVEAPYASSEEGATSSKKTVDPAVLEEVNRRIQAAEDRLTQRLESRLSEMENRLNNKMDKILKLLSPEEEDKEFCEDEFDVEESSGEEIVTEVCEKVPEQIDLD